MTEKQSILLVEDDPVIRRLIHQTLTENHNVETAENGKIGWQKLSEKPDYFNLIITDIDMPQMRGTELLEKIKKAFPNIGVILISGSADIDTAIDCIRKGAFDFVTKPLNSLSEIELLIDRWVYQQSLEAKLNQYARLHEEMMRAMSVCSFLSIDVVGSRKMKKLDDPFLVQFSFKKYHEFIAKIIAENEGSVVSTSGDGILASFKAAPNAVEAGLKILASIQDFNTNISRLEKKFNLRLGAHTGAVIIDKDSSISEMYSETLDISCHVQQKAAVNQLLISSVLKDHLGKNWRLQPVDVSIDDLDLFRVASAAITEEQS